MLQQWHLVAETQPVWKHNQRRFHAAAAAEAAAAHLGRVPVYRLHADKRSVNMLIQMKCSPVDLDGGNGSIIHLWTTSLDTFLHYWDFFLSWLCKNSVLSLPNLMGKPSLRCLNWSALSLIVQWSLQTTLFLFYFILFSAQRLQYCETIHVQW